LKSGGPVIPSLSIPLSPHSLSSPVKIMGVRTPATLSVCAYEQRVVCNQNTQQIIDVSCLRKSAQIYGPAWLRKNSSICCGVLRPLNLCDVCRACVYQVKVVFVKYPDECCPHGCARHARCCSDWLDGTLVGRGWWAFRCAMYRLIENKYFETFIILMICASSLSLVRHIRYDTIRDIILTCGRKQLRHESA